MQCHNFARVHCNLEESEGQILEKISLRTRIYHDASDYNPYNMRSAACDSSDEMLACRPCLFHKRVQARPGIPYPDARLWARLSPSPLIPLLLPRLSALPALGAPHAPNAVLYCASPLCAQVDDMLELLWAGNGMMLKPNCQDASDFEYCLRPLPT